MSDAEAGIAAHSAGAGDRSTVDESRLTDLYAYPDDLQACWVRGNMIASLDGGATDDGKAGGLAGPGDRAVFALMRHVADVIVVGAATVRIENYSGAQLSVAQRQARQRRGQAEVPPIAVVTQSGRPRPRREAVHPHRGAAADPDLQPIRRRDPAAGSARWPRSSTHRARDPTASTRRTALKILAERRLFRVLTEGGPLFLSLLIENGPARRAVPDVAPILVGGVARRIATGPGQVHTQMRRTHLLTDDEGYLYTRYVRGD